MCKCERSLSDIFNSTLVGKTECEEHRLKPFNRGLGVKTPGAFHRWCVEQLAGDTPSLHFGGWKSVAPAGAYTRSFMRWYDKQPKLRTAKNQMKEAA